MYGSLSVGTKMKPKTWNDVLALVFGLAIIVLWSMYRILNLPDILLGATISAFTLIIQFYFRRAKK